MTLAFYRIREDHPDFIGHIDEAYDKYQGKEMEVVVLDSDRKIVAVWVEEK